MLHKFVRTFWGDLTSAELKKFGFLSIIFALIVGNYWMMRPLKDALLSDLVGFQWQPWAKIVSVCVTVFIVLAYGKLVDMFAKHKLFYILCPFYGSLFLVFSYIAMNPGVAVLSSNSVFYPVLSLVPGKLVGWAIYVAIESSSLMITLFYSFLASTTSVEGAKKGYGMVFFIAQIGQLLGAASVVRFVQRMGAPAMLTTGGIIVLSIPFWVIIYMKFFGADVSEDSTTSSKPKIKTGFMGGLKLLLTRPYVAGIFVVSAFYEIIGTILEFQMNMIATQSLTRDAFAVFRGQFGIGVGILASIFALLGTSFFMRKLGLRFCLIAFPSIIGLIVGSIFITRTFGATDFHYMWLIFGSMIIIKGLNYTLNNPTKEVMYIPTSKDIKFKAKSWIDVFGNRSTKGVGGGVTAYFRTSLPDLLLYGTIASLGVVGIWIFVAHLVGHKFHELNEKNQIID